MESQASQEKAHLREYFLELRKLLPGKQSRSRQIFYQALATGLFDRAEHILLYASTEDEAGTENLIKFCLYRSKHVYLPVVEDISIAEMHSFTGLRPNKYGIMEPVTRKKKSGKNKTGEVEPVENLLKKVQLAVIPGVVFDFAGYRIGYGSGFYDLLMQKLPAAIRLGLAFNEQIIAAIPFEKHDRKLHYLVDDKKTYAFLKRETKGFFDKGF